MEIPEQQINPQMAQQAAPDVVAPQGQAQVFQNAVMANVTKQRLDSLLSEISSRVGGAYESRVKNIDTAIKKIAQKRLSGRDYDTADVNDMFGARIIVNNQKEVTEAKKMLRQVAEKGLFTIDKEEDVKKGTYHAYHMDINYNGQKAEIQLMLPQAAAESVVNHPIRSFFGENPPEPMKILREQQAQAVNAMPNDQATNVMQLAQKMQQTGNI